MHTDNHPETTLPQQVSEPRYALCIGINNYEYLSGAGRFENLSHARRDARRMGKRLEHGGRFNTTVVTDDAPDKYLPKHELAKNIRNFFKKIVEPNAIVVIFFAGHSITNSNKNLILMPSNGKDGDNTTYYSFFEFIDYLHTCKAKHVIFILDSCYSGVASTLFRTLNKPDDLDITIVGVFGDAHASERYGGGALTKSILTAFDAHPDTEDGWRKLDNVLGDAKDFNESLAAGQDIDSISTSKKTVKIYNKALYNAYEQRQRELEERHRRELQQQYDQQRLEQGIASQQIQETPLVYNPQSRTANTYYTPAKKNNYKQSNKIFIGIFAAFVCCLIVIGIIVSTSHHSDESTATPISIPSVSSIPTVALTAPLPSGDIGQTTSEANLGINLSLVPMDVSVKFPTSDRVYASSFISGKDRFVTISKYGVFSRWIIELIDTTFYRVHLESSISIPSLLNYSTPTKSKALAVSPDGKNVAVARGAGFSIISVEGNLSLISSSNKESEKGKEIEGISFSSDVKRLVTVSFDGVIKVWDVSDLRQPKLLRSLKSKTGLLCVSFLYDHTIGTGDENGRLQVWDVDAGNELNDSEVQIHNFMWSYWLAVAPGQYKGSRLVASVSGDDKPSPTSEQTSEIKLVLMPLPNDQKTSAPAPSRVFEPAAVVANPLTPTLLLYKAKETEWLYSTAFSPNGLYLAAAYGGGSIKIWETNKGQLLKDELVKSTVGGAKVTSIAFSSDGKWLVAGNDKGEVFAWKVTT